LADAFNPNAFNPGAFNPGAFNLGDLVQLKSGGPIMTVTETREGRVWTVWFAYGKRHWDSFASQTLRAAVPPEERPAASAAKRIREAPARSTRRNGMNCVIE
jgi:uncharacterized protein YodC (DUF2158 family)